MAVRGTELQLLGGGTDGQVIDRGAFVQNMLARSRAWEVRKGWGVKSQYSSMHLDASTDALNYLHGYEKHLGTGYILTDFGSEQFVSVFSAKVQAADGIVDVQNTKTSYQYVYIVEIYDATTNTRWAETLYRPTSSQQGGTRLPESWYGHHETNLSNDAQAWISPNSTPSNMSFVELNDILYFGNQELGVWSYIPTKLPNRANRGSIDTEYTVDWADPYSEQAVVIKVAAANGLYSDAFSYLEETLYPKPNALSELNGRLIVVDGRTIWFSDIGKPASIQALNYLTIPSEKDITAVASNSGALFIFTDTETWYYQPSSGNLASGGNLTRISSTIGCLNSNAVVRANAQIFWTDSNGAYISDGGYGIRTVSQEIEPFFRTFMTSPLTNFYAAPAWGSTTLVNEQPKFRFSYSDDAQVIYSPSENLFAITYPSQGISLVLTGLDSQTPGWALWTTYTDTAEDGGNPIVGVTRNIENPWMIATADNMYMLGGIDSQLVDDAAQRRGSIPVELDVNLKSFYLLEYGRGGALDKTYGALTNSEDNRGKTPYRGGFRWWNNLSATTTQDPGDGFEADGLVYIEPWIPLPAGTKLPNVYSEANTWLMPVTLVPAVDNNAAVISDTIIISMYFDNDEWEPVTASSGVSPIVEHIVPPERRFIMNGYDVQIKAAVGGAPDATGNVLEIIWTAAAATAAGDAWNQKSGFINLNRLHRNPFVYIPMRHKGTNDVSQAALEPAYAASTNIGRGGIAHSDFFYWDQGQLVNYYDDLDQAQAVGWAYVTNHVGLKEGNQFKARGLFIDEQSHGQATNPEVAPNWNLGILNIAVATDQRLWQGQIVDFSNGGINLDSDVPLIKPRVFVANYMRDKVFDGFIKWGSTIGSTTGNFIADDEQYQRISSSITAKGSWAQYVLWGYLRNKAEALTLGSVVATLRTTSQSRRRTGRQ